MRSASSPQVLGATIAEEDPEKHVVLRSQSAPVARTTPVAVARVVSQNLGELLRNISTSVCRLSNTEQHSKCVVCLEKFLDPELFAMAHCAAKQKHKMCKTCARCYFSGRVTEGRIADLRCPLSGSDNCQAVATEEELQSFLSAADFAKYERFVKLAEDPLLRDCPICHELVKPKTKVGVDGVISVDPEMSCSDGHLFCYYHSNAHDIGPGACEAYSRAQAKQQSALIASCGAKQCPKCGILTEKSSGCNQMSCPSCKVAWCWICGRTLVGRGSTGWHFNPANPAGCLQFAEMDDPAKLRSCMTLVVRVLAFPGTLLGLLAFWGVLPLWCLTCCFGMALSMILLIVFWCAWVPVGMVLSCLLGPCGLQNHHVEMLMAAPWLSCWASCECLFGPME